MKIISNSAEETIKFAVKIGKSLHAGDIIAYTGGLGAGKTTFTRGLAIGMGLKDEVISPTFALVNEYRGEKINLYHFDMYRISSVYDLEATGFYDYPLDESVFAIEWSENIRDALPENAIIVEIKYINDFSREIIIKGDGRFDDSWN